MRLDSAELDTAGRRPMSGPKHSARVRDRVEAVARTPAPDPKGKGLVMIILAISVLGALVWEFSGRGAAGKAAKESVERARRESALEASSEGRGASGQASLPVARPNPDEVETPLPPPPRRDAVPGTIKLQMGPTTATLPPALAVAAWLEATADRREAMRLEILEALLPLAKNGGNPAYEAFEAAAWLMDGAGEDAAEVILHLTNATTAAIEDDRAALGAILFLSRVADGVDKRTGLSLDSVIADSTRPLSIRLAAARVRPAEGRSKRVRELTEDPGTHPALRDALK